jgi:hypothetical protein
MTVELEEQQQQKQELVKPVIPDVGMLLKAFSKDCRDSKVEGFTS